MAFQRDFFTCDESDRQTIIVSELPMAHDAGHSECGRNTKSYSYAFLFSMPQVRKTVSFLFTLFIGLYLGIVLPSHHHDDFKEHFDCSICIAQAQAIETVAVYAVALFAAVSFVVFIFFQTFHVQSFVDCFHCRAPPVPHIFC